MILSALLAVQSFVSIAQMNAVVAPADFPKFIATRNIFDPERQPNVPWTAPRPRQAYTPPVVRQVDSFTLIGIIGYGEGRMAGVYAMFDGTSEDYNKTIQVNDSIANFKITDITADSVTLLSDTNSTTVLKIGEQLHNDGVGHWLSANGVAARYSNIRYGNGRNSGRNGYGNRRRNNYGNGNGNNANFNRNRNNFTGSATTDNTQADNQGMNPPDINAVRNDNVPPDDNMAPPDDNPGPDAGAQENAPVPQTDQPSASPTDSGDPNSVLQRLQQQRAQELQQTGH